VDWRALHNLCPPEGFPLISNRFVAIAGGAYVPTVSVGMYATQEGYDVGVSKLNYYDGLNHSRYLTPSIPRGGTARPSIDGFDSDPFGKQWVATLGELRQELSVRIVGYVLMPEEFYAPIGPRPEPRTRCCWAEAYPLQIMQELQDRTALFILFWNHASALAMDTVP
jgi:hypothetical protein